MKFVHMSLVALTGVVMAASMSAEVLSLASAFAQYKVSTLEQLSQTKPVAIKWSVPGCPPCGRMEPIFHSLATEFGDRAIFISENAQSYMHLVESYGISQVPTFQLFKGGKQVNRSTGETSKDSLRTMITTNLGI